LTTLKTLEKKAVNPF